MENPNPLHMALSYSNARRLSRTFLSLGLLLVILFILSTRFMLGVLLGSHDIIQASAGSIGWEWAIADFRAEVDVMSHAGPFFLDRNDAPIEWHPTHRPSPARGGITIPLIYPAVGLLLPGFVLALCHRHKPGCCRKCGYDLEGLEDGAPCPECGRPTPAAHV